MKHLLLTPTAAISVKSGQFRHILLPFLVLTVFSVFLSLFLTTQQKAATAASSGLGGSMWYKEVDLPP
jgi:hypothetical protein